jgi:two-component system, OmpR family, sensor histidine kinase TctE
MRRRRKPAEKPVTRPGLANHQPNSLFGEILDWMLAPLLFLWPISIIITHHVADNIANQPYDRALAEDVRTLSRMLTLRQGQIEVEFPASPRLLFRSDQDDTLYYQVADEQEFLISGDPQIPPPPKPHQPGELLFREASIQGEEVRIAYQWAHLPGDTGRMALVQVAETRQKRSDLASRVVTGVLLPQFAIIPLAVVLVWLGLTRGIAPLNRLQSLIRRRRPTDLSPIGAADVPEEVRPLIIAFNDMMQRLEENLQAQQRFIADAAHQMRTPLTGLKMQTDLALEETDPEQVRESLKRIARSAERASHLINQLLSLARAEASSEALYAVESVCLHKMVSDLAEDIWPRILAKRIDFGIEANDTGIEVEANPMLLREMIKNLMDNAIKYTPAGGTVTVRVCASQRHIVLDVEDTGSGIPETDRERVFERFYRVLGSGEDGSGLGLPIVREIADIVRARVLLLENPSGHGTVARVLFPLNQPARGQSIGLPMLESGPRPPPCV